MLLEKQAKVNDVVAVRLVSGEEIVGRLTSTSDTAIVIAKPLVLGMRQMQNPKSGEIETGMAFAPFMLSLAEEDGITLQASNIVTKIKARQAISDSYIQQTSSIELPSSPPLIV